MATAYRDLASHPMQHTRVAKLAGVTPVYLAVALVYLLLLPPQFNMSVGGSILPPYRLFLIVMLPFVVAQFIRERFRFTWPDFFVLAATAWMSFAMFMTSTQDEAITSTVANFTDVTTAYFFAKATLKSTRDLRMLLILALPGLVFVALTMVVESLTNSLVIQGLASQITGRPTAYNSSPRFGLMRATGPFPHPILAGIFLTSFLPLYLMAGFKPWPKIMGAFAGFCTFFTVSSAGLLGLSATALVLIYSWLTKRIANLTWSLFFFGMAVFIFVAELGTKSGTFSLFVRFASFNSLSAYNRVLIWRYGSQNAADNPWFGIGYADWERPAWMRSDSMDNYWLIQAVRFGIPASALIALATFAAVVLLIRKSTRSTAAEAECQRAVIISVAIYALGMISVSLWLSAQVWFYVLLGLAVSLVQERKPLPLLRQS